ncbi:hypothetical protein NHX12_014458, partial [Muraenolepis orangiensis]
EIKRTDNVNRNSVLVPFNKDCRYELQVSAQIAAYCGVQLEGNNASLVYRSLSVPMDSCVRTDTIFGDATDCVPSETVGGDFVWHPLSWNLSLVDQCMVSG